MKKYFNYFENLNPITLIIYFIGVLVLSFFFDSIGFLIVSTVSAFVMSLLLGGGKTAVYALPVIAFVIILNPLFSHTGETVLFYLNNNPITLEAVIYGVRTALIILSVLLWFSVFNRSVSEDKILYLFSGLFPTLALMVGMIFKSIKEFKRQYREMADSCKTLGFSLSEGSLKNRVRTGALFLNAVTGAGLENSVDTAVSMNARGYLRKGKTKCARYKFFKRDFAVMALSIVMSVGSSVLFAFRFNILSGILYALFLNIPFIFNALEELKWNFLK